LGTGDWEEFLKLSEINSVQGITPLPLMEEANQSFTPPSTPLMVELSGVYFPAQLSILAGALLYSFSLVQ